MMHISNCMRRSTDYEPLIVAVRFAMLGLGMLTLSDEKVANATTDIP